MVDKFKLTNAKLISTLMDPGSQYSVDQCPSTPNQMSQLQGVLYSEAIGSVLWPAVVSKPDIIRKMDNCPRLIQDALDIPGLS